MKKYVDVIKKYPDAKFSTINDTESNIVQDLTDVFYSIIENNCNDIEQVPVVYMQIPIPITLDATKILENESLRYCDLPWMNYELKCNDELKVILQTVLDQIVQINRDNRFYKQSKIQVDVSDEWQEFLASWTSYQNCDLKDLLNGDSDFTKISLTTGKE